MKETYTKPSMQIIALPEEELFATSGESSFSKIFDGGDELYGDAPSVKSNSGWAGSFD